MFQADDRYSHVFAIQSCVIDPLPQTLVLSQCASNLEPKVSGVCIHESRRDASVAPVSVYEA